ncbi:MAG: hypothetical protein K0S76_1020 [Herbinix sp.]|jgi:hypothetical protein|nr:hypothetical protein [Herbinix sp.]
MLDIAEALKTIYKNDTVPKVSKNVRKDLQLNVPALNLTVNTDRFVDDSFELDESLFSDHDIRFGACEAAQIKFTLANVPEELKGQEFTINQLISGYTVPLGKYKVDSAKKQDNLIFKDVIAYDKLKKADDDVSSWYNTRSFPMTLAAFRASLLSYLGIVEELRSLPNDSMLVQKTIEPTQLSGRKVLEACEEINGCFGHINRLGKFVHIILEPAYGLYPTINLYPAEDLNPVVDTDTSFFQDGSHAAELDEGMYHPVTFEEYTVKGIDKLQIRSEEHDIGAIVGTGTNAYVIEGNFLVFGKSATELEAIAWNAFSNINRRPYRPYQSKNIGLPYIEVGDTIKFKTEDPVTGYVFKRTLSGIQVLQDEYSADGSEEREQNHGVNNEVIQLQGKATKIKKDVEGIQTEVSDLAQNTQTRFDQTAIAISAEASRASTAEGQLDSKITLTADEIKQETSQTYATKNELSTYADTVAGSLNDLQNQIDGNITTWFYNYEPTNSNAPATGWDTTEKKIFILATYSTIHQTGMHIGGN